MSRCKNLRRRYWAMGSIGWGLLLLCLPGFFACSQNNSTVTVLTPKMKVKLIHLEEKTLAQEIQSFGSISFRTKVDLSPLVDGVIAELPLPDGSVVKTGAVLARLRNPQLESRKTQADAAFGAAQSAVELAQAQLWAGHLQVEGRITAISKAELEIEQKRSEIAELERNLRNKQSLLAVGGVTEETVNNLKMSLSAQKTELLSSQKDLEIKRIGLRDSDIIEFGMTVSSDPGLRAKALLKINTATLNAELAGAQSRLESARVDVQSAQMLLRELVIEAPGPGIVGARYAEIGEHIQANTKLVTIINTEMIYAVFPVAEQDAMGIVSGQTVQVDLDALTGQKLTAKVDLVSPVIDSQSGAVTVKAILNNEDARIKPGMFARVRVKTGEPRQVVVIPESAIFQKTGLRAKVLTAVNGRAFVKEITLDRDLGGSFGIKEGLLKGETVIDTPSPLLKEGEAVEE